MGAADIFKLFQTPQESLGERIYRRASYDSPWLNVIPSAEFKEGTGLTQTTFQIANTEPSSVDEDWPAITLSTSGGTTAPCATTYTSVRPGYTTQTYAPEQFGLLGPILCKDDPIFEYNVAKFLTGYLQELSKRAKRSWENRLQSLYHQYATVAVVSNATAMPTLTDGLKKFWASETSSTPITYGSTGLLSGASFVSVATAAPTVPLNQDHLDQLAYELIQRGATNPDSNGWITLGSDGPVFSLLISPEASRRILKEDTSTGFRTDVRYGAENELMKRIGATKTLLNFRHVPDVFPPRYGFGAALACATTNTSTTVTSAALFGGLCVGMPVSGTGIPANTYITAIASTSSLTISAAATATGSPTLTFGVANKFHRVQTFENTSATQGLKSTVTTGYKNAPYESATIISPYVVTSEKIRPVDMAGGVEWDPTNYMGEWKFIAGANNFDATVTDPLKKRGAHIAEFKHAPRPEFPEYGMVIIFKRS